MDIRTGYQSMLWHSGYKINGNLIMEAGSDPMWSLRWVQLEVHRAAFQLSCLQGETLKLDPMICWLHGEGSHGEATNQVLLTKELVSLANQ